MDATQLYEIVKDWPRIAWPTDLIYHSTVYPAHFHLGPNGAGIDASLVALAFEASGMRYLTGGLHVVETECCGDQGWAIMIRSLISEDDTGRPTYLYNGALTGEGRSDPIYAISQAVIAMAARREEPASTIDTYQTPRVKDCYARPKIKPLGEEPRDFSKSPCNTGDYLQGEDDGELDYRTGED